LDHARHDQWTYHAEMPILWVNGSNDFAYTLGAMQQ
jgi:hypothetical protein